MPQNRTAVTCFHCRQAYIPASGIETRICPSCRANGHKGNPTACLVCKENAYRRWAELFRPIGQENEQ